MLPEFIEIILFLGTIVLAVLSFVGLRIFKHIDVLNNSIKEFQKDIDTRLYDFRRDFDKRCDVVHSRLNKHGERLAKLEVK